MKKVLSLVLTIALTLSIVPTGLFTITASAATSDYYTYTVSSGCATITDVDTSISGDVVIPDTLGGAAVTKIGDKAFQSCRKMTGVTIPNTVTSIGAYAFDFCSALIYVEIPDSITFMGNQAFGTCTGLEIVCIEDLAAWCNIDFTGYPSNPLSYAEYISIDDTLVFDLEIPDTVTTIKTCAFGKCVAIETVTIPDSVTTIESNAFFGCTELRRVNIPDSVTDIGTNAFGECTSLTSITIPESLTSIESSVFKGCTGLSKLYITDKLQSIGWYAFGNCTSLQSVYFLGDDKSSVSIDSTGNDAIINATWYCTCRNHLYDNACDTSCNRCKTTRSITHTYSNNCDAACNVCGFVRTVPDHIYTSICDTSCNECGAVRTTTHTYDNACDEVCNICEETRSIRHSYDNACDASCNVCGYERIPSDHAFQWVIDQEETCGESGVKHEECTVCHTKRNENTTIDATGNHTFQWVIDQEETCGEDGVKHEECTVCHAKQHVGTSIPSTGNHTYDDVCDAICNTCAFERTAPHRFAWVIDQEETCGEDGVKHEECTVCHTKRNENTTIDATGNHTFQWVIDQEETCGEEGIKHEECTVCHTKQNVGTSIPFTGNHTYDDVCDAICNTCAFGRTAPHHFAWVIDQEETCGEDGVKHEECTLCHAKRNENTVMDATGNHTFQWVIDQEETCGEDGIKHEECTVCHTKQNVGTSIPSTGNHIYDDVCDAICNTCAFGRTAPHRFAWVIDQEETCGEDGVKHEECTLCHAKRNENTVMNATGNHDFQWAIDQKETCGEEGIKHEECTVCHAKRNESTPIPPNEQHVLTDATDRECDVCHQCYVVVILHANGGTATPSLNVWQNTATVQLPDDLVREGYRFAGWSSEKNGDVEYPSGGTYSADCDTALYAQWDLLCDAMYEDRGCSRCGGDGEVYSYSKTCSSCSGTGTSTSTCYWCDGTGKQSTTTKCSTCNGTGDKVVSSTCATCSADFGFNVRPDSYCYEWEHSIWITTVPCGDCDGTGKVLKTCVWCSGSGKNACWRCDGSGKESVYTTCTKCSGSGTEQGICSLCDGTGVVVRREVFSPGVPIVEHVYCNAIVLQAIENGEYSIDGVHWQESPVFEGLVFARGYTIYQRYAKTDTTLRSAPAGGQTVTTAHVYDNACDAACNVCAEERAVPDHVYDNACDTTCNVCALVREVPDHVYDTACDEDCNACGFMREAPHLYEIPCDPICNGCGLTREVPHFYDDAKDRFCNLCGHNRAKTAGKTGDCDWYVIDTTLYIYGNGAMASYSNTGPWGNTITKVVFEEGVTAIGDYAFYNCDRLTTVDIPNTITSIGDSAFEYCGGLLSVTIGDGVTAIGDDAFDGCSLLESVYITDLKAWCEIEFDGLWGNPLYYADNLYVNGVLATDLVIPYGTTAIGEYAFADFDGFTSVTIPNTVTTIGYFAFYDCDGFAAVTIPDSVTSIGTYAFRHCDRLLSVTIGDGVTEIPENAFHDCTWLETVIMGNGVTDIASNAFYNCFDLADVWYTGADSSVISIAYGNTPLTNANWHCNADVDGEHLYDSACHIICNICGDIRVAPHKYDSVCDTTCECGHTRPAANHVYDIVKFDDEGHWSECACGEQGAMSAHTFVWVIDQKETCGEDGVKHEECTVCHAKRNEGTRVPSTGNHTYDDMCDAICNGCGWERVTALMGDVNGDNKVDSTDARLVLQYAVGKINADAINMEVADVNGDGKADSTDARLILQHAVGKIQKFPNQ